MGILWVGPWHLDPTKTDGRFNVEKFIADAEAGKYDGREPFCLNRKAPWYQQFKLDVEAGVYDDRRLNDERLAFQEWLDRMLRSNPQSADRPVDRWYRMFLMSNSWIIMAMNVANKVPDCLCMKVHTAVSSFMHHPECGWRAM